jgi:hypothetical protein
MHTWWEWAQGLRVKTLLSQPPFFIISFTRVYHWLKPRAGELMAIKYTQYWTQIEVGKCRK